MVNFKFTQRTDCGCYIDKDTKRPDITKAYPEPHEKRFISLNATSFCGGEISTGLDLISRFSKKSSKR